VITHYSHKTHKSAINEFWKKEMAVHNDINIIMKNEVNSTRVSNNNIEDNSIMLIPFLRKNHIINKIVATVFFYVHYFIYLRRTLREKEYDLIHTYNFLLGSLFLNFLVIDKKKIKSFGWSFDFIGIQEELLKEKLKLYYLYYLIKLKIHKFVFNNMLRKSDIFCPITEYLSEKIFKDNGIKIDSFPINQNATNLYLNNMVLSNYNKLVDRKKKRLVYIGTIDKLRDSIFLIDVLKLIKYQIKNVELLFIGWVTSSKYNDELRNHIKELKLTNNIRFVGKMPYSELPKLLVKCDVGLSNIPPFSYYLISSPTKIFNYLSLGIPTVANKEIYDQKNVIEQSGGGFAVEYDVRKFADSIIWLLENPQKAKVMGERSREWLEKNRSYELLASGLTRKYNNMVKKIINE